MHILHWVEILIKQDYGIGAGEIDPNTSSSCRQNEAFERTVLPIEKIDRLLSILLLRAYANGITRIVRREYLTWGTHLRPSAHV